MVTKGMAVRSTGRVPPLGVVEGGDVVASCEEASTSEGNLLEISSSCLRSSKPASIMERRSSLGGGLRMKIDASAPALGTTAGTCCFGYAAPRCQNYPKSRRFDEVSSLA